MLGLISSGLDGLLTVASLAVPFAVLAVSLRRAWLSESRNLDRYAAICGIAAVVFYANSAALLVMAESPHPLLTLAVAIGVLALWMVTRHSCGLRRKHYSRYASGRRFEQV